MENKTQDGPTFTEAAVVLTFILVVSTLVGVYLYYNMNQPAPQPRQTIDLDFSSRNIGNKIGKEAGEFSKGFIKGILGKDKNGNER